jgi:hypothetical protein
VLLRQEPFLTPQQFGVDLRDLFELLLQGTKMLGALAGRSLLRFTLEEKLIHFAHRQALGQIVEGAMLGSPVMTMTLGFATRGKAFHDRSAQKVGGNSQLPKEKAFALAQSQSGFTGVIEYPRHVYGQDKKIAAPVNKKENAPKIRKRSTP